MTTLAIDTPVHAFGSLRDADGAGRDFHSWELHSELVLVCPDLRERSLELLLEPASPAVAKTERQTDVSTSLPAADSPAEASAVLRYAVRRVGEMTRFGLAIVGAIVALAMLAELLSR